MATFNESISFLLAKNINVLYNKIIINGGNNMTNLLDAVKLAYRKHVMNDDSIGWDELGYCLLDAICNEIGDDGYQKWISRIRSGLEPHGDTEMPDE